MKLLSSVKDFITNLFNNIKNIALFAKSEPQEVTKVKRKYTKRSSKSKKNRGK